MKKAQPLILQLALSFPVTGGGRISPPAQTFNRNLKKLKVCRFGAAVFYFTVAIIITSSFEISRGNRFKIKLKSRELKIFSIAVKNQGGIRPNLSKKNKIKN